MFSQFKRFETKHKSIKEKWKELERKASKQLLLISAHSSMSKAFSLACKYYFNLVNKTLLGSNKICFAG